MDLFKFFRRGKKENEVKYPDFLNENLEIKKGEDIYSNNFEKLANNIVNVVNSNGKDRGIKIAIYGKWGSGKSTLANIIKNKKKKGVYIINARNSTSLYDFQKWFFFSLQTDNKIVFFVTYFIQTILLFFVLGFLFSILGASSISNLGDLGNGVFLLVLSFFILPLIKNLLVSIFRGSIISEHCLIVFLWVTSVFNNRRLLIVDDLDRVKPEILPEILLWLDHLSVYQKGMINTIILTDPEKISEGIKVSYGGMLSKDGDGYGFLEKMVDVPFFLPNLTNVEKYNFWNQHKEDFTKSFNKLKYFEDLVQYLPNNIRQIKRYFKFLYTNYKEEVNRYGDDELDIKLLFIIILMKFESPEKVEETLKIFSTFTSSIFYIGNTSYAKKAEREVKINDFLKEYSDDMLIQKYSVFFLEEHYLSYAYTKYLYFLEKPALITDKELLDKKDKNFNDVLSFCYNDNFGLLKRLSDIYRNSYSNMISLPTENEISDKKEDVGKIINFIDFSIEKLDENYVQSELEIKSIIDNLTAYLHFNISQNGVNHNEIQEKVKTTIDKFLNKIDIEILYGILVYRIVGTSKSESYIEEKREEYKGKYFENILEKISGDHLESESFRMYEKVREEDYNLFFNKLSDKLDSDNKKLKSNSFNIIYGILSERNIEKIEIRTLDNILEKLEISNINSRRVGSFKEELVVLEDVSEYYDLFNKYI